ncbi:MAG: hypothetical protein ACXWF2_10160 [Usitatibacter sp.]
MRAFVWVMVICLGIEALCRFCRLVLDTSDDTSGDAFAMASFGGLAIWGALVL